MSRNRRPRPSRRERRRSHAHSAEDCIIARPPSADDDAWLGLCENLGLWRIKAPPFDAHGIIGTDGGLDGFYAALEDAVTAIRAERPDLAAWLQALLHR